MTTSFAPDPVDADRWLYLHLDQVVGAGQAAAVDLVHRAGLLPHVVEYHDEPPEPDRSSSDGVRLFLGDDGKVRAAQSGS
jgi:hypothetical protein